MGLEQWVFVLEWSRCVERQLYFDWDRWQSSDSQSTQRAPDDGMDEWQRGG
jgi:hypothetical protein